MGALTLQNELVRAVGNMNVNARGDRVDESNQVIDQRNRQIQRQHRRTSNVVDEPAHTSTVAAKKSQTETPVQEPSANTELLDLLPEPIPTPTQAAPVDLAVDPAAIPASGLAAALAKAKTVKQTLDPSAKQLAQSKGVHKL
jgi:hypothetical protein